MPKRKNPFTTTAGIGASILPLLLALLLQGRSIPYQSEPISGSPTQIPLEPAEPDFLGLYPPQSQWYGTPPAVPAYPFPNPFEWR